MGSRGAFVDVASGNFNFKEDGQEYYSLGTLSSDPNVKILALIGEGSVSTPSFSHTPGRIYAVTQKGRLKYLTYYDDSHNKKVTVDLGHAHNKVRPHIHYGNGGHGKDDPAIPPTKEQLSLIRKIKKEYNLK